MNPNPKNFTPEGVQKSETAAREESILQFWKDNNIFEKTLIKESPMGDFVFFEGPPTANGRPGIHHVGARSFKDIIPRYKTMRGFNVQRRAGWDTHGLPVELQVEKQLGLKSKKEIEIYGVAEYNKKCRESVWEYKDEWEVLTDRMGYWLDMEHPYITYENGYIESLWGVVKKISERKDQNGNDLMYKDFKILPWCTRCGTALSSHELNQPGAYQDVKDVTAYVKFKVKAKDNLFVVAWTTTPWTLPGNIALAVGKDIKYVFMKKDEEVLIVSEESKDILGEGYELVNSMFGEQLAELQYEPLYPFMSDLLSADQQPKLENAFQVYAADFVTTTDGTGIVHIAPMYGADDFNLATDNNLPKFHVVNEEGKYINGCDTDAIKLSGRHVKESDESGKPTLAIDIINDLTARNLLFKKENYAHSYPHCWRCNTPLLYYARGSWFFRMSSLREQLLAANENINWEPDHIKAGRFGEWLDNIKDWAISRERYWGTPIPVWETSDGGKRVVIGSFDDIKKYSKKSGNKYFVMRHGQAESNVKNVWDYQGDPNNHLTDDGRDQAKKSADELSSKKIDLIIASPILRAQETAKIVAETIGYNPENIVTDARVIEWQVGGDYQEKNLDSYLAVRNAAPNRYTYRAEGGESFQDVIKRCGEFLHEIDSQYQGKNILIVGHNSSARGLILASSGFTFETLLKNPPQEYPFKNAEIRALDFTQLPHNENYELDFHKPYIDQVELELDGEKLTRTSAIMDVWFDSGAMAYAQAHNLGEPVDFSPKPADFISEGVDQTRGWFYTMHAIANLLNDKPTNNYKNVICLGLLMAADGTKMSKSKGNIVSPWKIFEEFGADVARFWFYSVNQPGDSKNFDEKSLDEVKKKVFNPLLNVVSFYEMYKPAELPNLNPFDSTNVLDQWILANLQNLSRMLVKNLDEYKILESARGIRDFINELSTWYVRRSRDRFKSENESDKNFALVTLQYVLEQLSRYMAPFTPFVAEDIFLRVRDLSREESVHLTHWHMWDSESRFADTLPAMQIVRDMVTLGLEARQQANVKVRQPLSKLFISPSDLSDEYLEIIKDELNVKEIVMKAETNSFELTGNQVTLDTNITEDLRNEGEMRDLVRQIQDMRKDANLMPSDRVVVYLEIPEPTWFGNSELQKELLTTVGAQEIKWGSEVNKVEIK